VRHFVDFKTQVLGEKDQLVVVYYSAPWCPQCKTMDAFMFMFVQDYKEVAFLKVEVNDSGVEICKQRSIDSFPSFEFFKNAKSLAVLIKPDHTKVQTYVERLRNSIIGRRWIYNILPDYWLLHTILRILLMSAFTFHCYSMYLWYFPNGKNSWLIIIAALVISKKVLDRFWGANYGI